MAQVSTCDGCRATNDAGDLVERGYARKKEYCPQCLVRVLEFERARDELHTKMALQWVAQIARLTTMWKQALPDGELPDGGYL